MLDRSLDLRANIKSVDDYNNNPELQVLRKLIHEETGTDLFADACGYVAPAYSGSGYSLEKAMPSHFSVAHHASIRTASPEPGLNRISRSLRTPGQWAAQARDVPSDLSRRSPQEGLREKDLPLPLPDSKALAAAEVHMRRQHYPPRQEYEQKIEECSQTAGSVEKLANVDHEAARQVEETENAITGSWISRLFGLGGFQKSKRKSENELDLQKVETKKNQQKSTNFNFVISNIELSVKTIQDQPKAEEQTNKHWIPEQISKVGVAEEKKGQTVQLPIDRADAQSARSAPSAPSAPKQGVIGSLLNPILNASIKTKEETTKEQDIVRSLGLVLSTKNGEVVFIRALLNSPADALLKVDATKMIENDVLIAIDGDNVYKWPLFKVVDKLSGEKDTVATLHFLRGNQQDGDQPQSLRDSNSQRKFVTLIRGYNENDLPNAKVGSGKGVQANPGFNTKIDADNDFDDFSFLIRQPLLSETQLQNDEGLAVEMNNKLRERERERERELASRHMSKGVEEEMKALNQRVSKRSSLSLGHSMLRPVDCTDEKLKMTKNDDMFLQLKKAAEISREQYRELNKLRSSLKEEAVDKVKEWGDRERRIAQYMGLQKRF